MFVATLSYNQLYCLYLENNYLVDPTLISSLFKQPNYSAPGRWSNLLFDGNVSMCLTVNEAGFNKRSENLPVRYFEAIFLLSRDDVLSSFSSILWAPPIALNGR